MTNQQLYIAVGAPLIFGIANLLLVFVGFLVQSRNIDKRFDQQEKSFDQQDKRFDRLESKVDRMDTTLHAIHLMLGRHDARLDALEKERR